jgi:hypothetical protein
MEQPFIMTLYIYLIRDDGALIDLGPVSGNHFIGPVSYYSPINTKIM